MKNTILSGLLAALLLGAAIAPPGARAALVTEKQALVVAGNYLKMNIAREGSWGGHPTARVAGIEPLRRGQVQLAWYCPVEPEGFLVVALHDELAPIRCCSGSGRLDPDADDGFADVIKVRLEGIYRDMRERTGLEPVRIESFDVALPFTYRGTWSRMRDPAFDALEFVSAPEPILPDAPYAYAEGDSLMDFTWAQRAPYNALCPDLDCAWVMPPTHPLYNENAPAGCVAIAGAMILRYWNWPPVGTGGAFNVAYDWPNMADRYEWFPGAMEMYSLWDGGYSVTTQAEADAVSLLARKVGVGLNMNYGCDASGSQTEDLTWVLPDYFRTDPGSNYITFDPMDVMYFWNMLKVEINNLRPIAYRIPGHAVVVDGWRETGIGGETTYEYHVHYGANGYNDGWFPLGAMPGGDLMAEAFVNHIAPEPRVEGVLAGYYPVDPYFPYLYLGREAAGYDAAIYPGHRLQMFGPDFRLGNLGTGTVEVRGRPNGLETTFFHKGDEDGKTRIRIQDGAIKLTNGGEIVVY